MFKKILITVVIIGILGAGVYFFSRFGELPVFTSSGESVFPAFDDTPKGEVSSVEIPTVPDAANFDLGDLAQEHRDPQFGFSFRYPKDLKVSRAALSDGSVSVAISGGKEGTAGFQILITPLDEPLTLDTERIRADLPDLVISESKEFSIDGGTGVLFASDDPGFNGDSREVWFVRGTVLFQISTYGRNEKLLDAILKTWRFN